MGIKHTMDRMFNVRNESLEKKILEALSKQIMPGRYAIEDPDDGVLKFYKVDIGKEGKWFGSIFLSIQGGDEFYSVTNMKKRNKILNEIMKEGILAMQRYGRELGHCAICGLTLTDEESRRRGIGPICFSKL